MAIYAKGRAQFGDAHPNEPAAIRAARIEHDIYQANERELRNLHLQEARLRRLQAERRAAAREQLELEAKNDNKPSNPEELGFEFSKSQSGNLAPFSISQESTSAARPEPQSTPVSKRSVNVTFSN